MSMTVTTTSLRSLLPTTTRGEASFQDLVLAHVKAQGIEKLKDLTRRVGMTRAVESICADAGIPNPAVEAAAFVSGFHVGSLPICED